MAISQVVLSHRLALPRRRREIKILIVAMTTLLNGLRRKRSTHNHQESGTEASYIPAENEGPTIRTAETQGNAEDTGKLGPKWEGPYEVTEALGKGAYKLRDMDGRELPRTWNICNLKKCYL
ncbi:hypothetical protein Tco_0558835 [Tanacetum coccineum]